MMVLHWSRTANNWYIAMLPYGEQLTIKWKAYGNSGKKKTWELYHTHSDGVERHVPLTFSAHLWRVRLCADEHMKKGCHICPELSDGSYLPPRCCTGRHA